MARPGPTVTSGADVQLGSNPAFPTGFGGGGSATLGPGSVGTGEIADGTVALVDLAADVKGTLPLLTPAVSTATTGTLAVGANHRLDATSAPLARTLPTAASAGAGGIVVVKKIDATSNAVTVSTGGSDTLNVSGSTRTLSLPREAAHFRSDGVSDWTVVASDTPVSQLDTRYPLVASAIGYDVIIAAGQSNMSGRAVADATRYETVHPHVFTYDTAGTYPSAVTQAVVPLGHADRTTLGNTLGPDFGFAKIYADTIAAPQGRRVLVVPVAYGGTGFASSAGTANGITLQWDPAGSTNLYTQAISQANEAMAAAGPNARLVAFLWLQGEADGIASMSGPSYQAKLDALIAGFRAGITGATSTTPFVLGGMVPEFVANYGAATASAVAAVHVATPGRVASTGYAPGTSSTQNGDNLHYNAAGQRHMARSMWLAYRYAKANVLANAVPGRPGTPTAASGDTQVTLTWQAPAASPSISDYLIEYKAVGAATWSTFAHTASTSTSAAVTGLTNGTAYDFRVSAVNSVGTGDSSSVASATPVHYIVLDDFHRADSTTTLGTTPTGGLTWTAVSGTWGISSNMAYCATGIVSGNAIAVVDTGQASGTLSYTAGIEAAAGPGGIAFRVTDDNNYWLFTTGTGLYKKVTGSFTNIANSSPVAAGAGDVFTVVLSGNVITCYKNGVQVATTTDSYLATNTKHGLRSFNNQGTAEKCAAFSMR